MKTLLFLLMGLALFGSDYEQMKKSFDKGDINRAISITRSNAMKGNIPAMYDLGLLYYAKGDAKKAKTWLQRSVKNEGRGALAVGLLLFSQSTNNAGYKKAAASLVNEPKGELRDALMAVSKDLAANRHDASAENYLVLGELFSTDKVIHVNMRMALFLTDQAAKKGSQRAKELMGDAYWRSAYTRDSALIVRQSTNDAETALAYYRDASTLGNLEATAKVGKLLLIGPYYLIDVRQGASLILKSAEGGSALGAKMAAELYMNGQGVRANREKALEWYLKATEICDVNNTLARIYRQGEEAEKYTKAYKVCSEEGSAKQKYHILFEPF